MKIPVILFPGNIGTLSRFADAVLFMTLLNSRNPYWISQAQMLAAPLVKQFDLEALRKHMGKPYFLTSSAGTTRNILQDLEKVGPETDEDSIRNILGRLSYSFTKDYPDLYRQYFISLSELLRKMGFYFRHGYGEFEPFLEKINSADIPLTIFQREIKSGPRKGIMLRYHVAMKIQEGRIAEVLDDDADLQSFKENPVRQIAGIALQQLPNTTQLRDAERYGRVLNLCRSLGIRVGEERRSVDQLLAEGITPVFAYSHYDDRRDKMRWHLYFPITTKAELSRHLLRQARRLMW